MLLQVLSGILLKEDLGNIFEMKYTKYLMDGSFINMKAFSTKKKFLKIPLRLISIPVAVMGIATVAGLLPAAFITDEIRQLKCQTILNKRKKMNKVSRVGNFLGMIAAMNGMFNLDSIPESSPKPNPGPTYKPLTKACPAGCKHYFFNSDGEFRIDNLTTCDNIFECWALNDRSALRKFYNWNNGNSQNKS